LCQKIIPEILTIKEIRHIQIIIQSRSFLQSSHRMSTGMLQRIQKDNLDSFDTDTAKCELTMELTAKLVPLTNTRVVAYASLQLLGALERINDIVPQKDIEVWEF